MIEILALIGCCWIIKGLWKTGVLTMDKKKVLAAISGVRKSISDGIKGDYPNGTAAIHASLDEVIAAVAEPDKVLENSEQSLEEHIVAHLLLRKREKERSQLAQKAKEVIGQIEKE